jgi:amino acid transporter
MIGTSSVGISLILWLVGALYTVAGTYLYIEFGLTIPRSSFGGVEQGIPRNGGTLNYLQYAFSRPAYRPRTVLLVTCIFAVSYIIIGNVAGNCLIFGLRTLEAAYVPVTNRKVRLIAAGAATFASGIHVFSRRGGIWLSNVLAAIKVLILLLIVITGICAWAGAFKTKTYAIDNMTANVAFADPSRDLYGYVKAFLAIIFAWTGFDQPNYVRNLLIRKDALLTSSRFWERSEDREQHFPRGRKLALLLFASCICW